MVMFASYKRVPIRKVDCGLLPGKNMCQGGYNKPLYVSVKQVMCRGCVKFVIIIKQVLTKIG